MLNILPCPLKIYLTHILIIYLVTYHRIWFGNNSLNYDENNNCEGDENSCKLGICSLPLQSRLKKKMV